MRQMLKVNTKCVGLDKITKSIFDHACQPMKWTTNKLESISSMTLRCEGLMKVLKKQCDAALHFHLSGRKKTTPTIADM